MKFPYSITWFRYQVDWIERELGRKLKKKEVELLKLFYIKEYEEKQTKTSRKVTTGIDESRNTSTPTGDSN